MAFVECENHEGENQEIMFDSPHGRYAAHPRYVDAEIWKNLPNSIDGLRAIAEEQSGHEFDKVDSIIGFLVILADFEQDGADADYEDFGTR